MKRGRKFKKDQKKEKNLFFWKKGEKKGGVLEEGAGESPERRGEETRREVCESE